MASAAPYHPVTEEGLNTFRYHLIIRKWGKRVMLTIFEYNFLHGTGKTILEVLQDAGVNLGRKSRFNSLELDKITRNVPPDRLDITAVYKISFVLWDHNVNVPTSDLKDHMKKIKDERNCISHEEIALTQSELIVKLDDFGNILEIALNEAQAQYSHLGADFDSMKNEIQADILKIKEKIREKYDLSNPDDLAKFQEEIKDNIDYLHELLHEESKRELEKVCVRLCKITPFDWMPQYDVADPSDILVPLQMKIAEEFHPKFAPKHLITLDQKDILDLKDPSGKDPEVIILTGNAGSGKTTVLSSVVEKWCKDPYDIPNLSSFQMLLYMQFRSHDHNNFDDYLKDRLPITVSKYGIENVKASILNSKCLVLCDGYDESNPHSKKLFESLLKPEYKQLEMIVTARPSSAKDLTHAINKSNRKRLNLNMLGVADNNVELHIKKIISYVKSDDTERQEMETEIIKVFKLMGNKFLQVLKIPLWLNLYILLYIEYPEKRGNCYSVTSLYQQLTKQKIERIVSNLGVEEDKVCAFQEYYTQLSFRYHQEQTYELPQQDAKVFEKKCKDLGLNFNSIMSSFFNIKHTKKGVEIIKVYCYRHRTEQEYAAAAYISELIIEFCFKKRTLVDTLKAEGKSVFYNALVSDNNALVSSELLEETQGASDNESDFHILQDILVFITGILYNAKADSALEMVIDDIMNIHWLLEHGDEEDPSVDIDFLTDHYVETRNDQRVFEAVIRTLKLCNVKSMETRDIDRLGISLQIIRLTEPRDLSFEFYRPLQRSLELQMGQATSGAPLEIPDSVQKFNLQLRHYFNLMEESSAQNFIPIWKSLIPEGMQYQQAQLTISSRYIDLTLSKAKSHEVGLESPTVDFKIKLFCNPDDDRDPVAIINNLVKPLLREKEYNFEVTISGKVQESKMKPELQMGQAPSGSHLEILDSVHKFTLELTTDFDLMEESSAQKLIPIWKSLIPEGMQYKQAELEIDGRYIDLTLSKARPSVVGLESPTVHFKFTLRCDLDEYDDRLAQLYDLANSLWPVDKESYLEVVIIAEVPEPQIKTDQQQESQINPRALTVSSPSNSSNQQGYNTRQNVVCGPPSVDQQGRNAGPSTVTTASTTDQQQGCNIGPTSTVPPLKFVVSPKKITLVLGTTFDSWSDGTVQWTAMLANGFWSRMRVYDQGNIKIKPLFLTRATMTKEAIKQLGELLTIEPDVGITIEDVTEDVMGAKEELSAFYKKLGRNLVLIEMDRETLEYRAEIKRMETQMLS